MENRAFGKTVEGKEATLYTIKNENGMSAAITDFGAALVSLCVKDKDGKLQDVVLGYDDVSSYQKETCYFGATVGRNGNRIADARFSIDGVEYSLEVNDNENNLHSGSKGTSERFWKMKEQKESEITFTLEDAHLEQGYPGNAVMDVTYALTEDNALAIRYRAVSDKKTVFNFTNHSYFNLNGHASGDVLDHLLTLCATHYTPVKDSKAIPTGEIAPVEGTPFDFREAKTIGQDINAMNDQLKYGCGYDHNYVLDREGDGIERAATLYSPKTGICMEVLTDCVAIQLYTGNFIEGQKGKGGVTHPKRGGVCLETQYCPNSVNDSNFASPITDANVPYESETIYKFTVA